MGQHITGYLQGPQSAQIFYQAWRPARSPDAVVAIAHGLGGHSGQFRSVGEAWVRENLAVFCHDFRGHGLSKGQRAYIRCWEEYVSDLALLLGEVSAQYPNSPCFLWGHSLGGVIALDAVLQGRLPVRGLILTAPAIGQTGIPAAKLWLGRILSAVLPRFSLNVGLEPRSCSRDPAVVQQYETDPLHHTLGTARLSTEYLKAVERIHQQAPRLQTPLLLLHGGGDRITSPRSSQQFYDQLTVSDRLMIRYPHAFHELHLDINRAQVLADILDWIRSHLLTPKTVT
ncbi:alpha/beta hydrolase [Lyngbya confervoides]|uniref:Monoacylglycerol lipase n=1 Tax=Lyngbya confervoides BDU141951 TaxID=1574623 RepID=A0ABD4T434_9CYAN|nr:alpha/beta hydrolase [Lyngbya confervoides]MCM1983186.1 lysophospholipase [Lyngbya confervoides BDU141951]